MTEVEEVHVDVPVSKSKKQIEQEVMEELRGDFEKQFSNYIRHSDTIDWKRVPGVIVPTDRDMTWKDLWEDDMGVVMTEYFFKDDVDGTKYGHLPKMTVTSKGVMGSLMVSSFCERINSCANLVCTKNNNLLSDDEIDMTVTLRMNRDFMEHIRLTLRSSDFFFLHVFYESIEREPKIFRAMFC